MTTDKRFKVTGQITNASLATHNNVYEIGRFDSELDALSFAQQRSSAGAERTYVFDTAQHYLSPAYAAGAFVEGLKV